jgi:hypothetical protein
MTHVNTTVDGRVRHHIVGSEPRFPLNYQSF